MTLVPKLLRVKGSPSPTLPMLRLARRSHYRQAGYVDSLAPQRLPAVLEMEIATSWPSPRTC
jgi:hypothetical protein